MTQGPRHRLTLDLTAIAAALLLGPAAYAQTSAPGAGNSLERAQKAADAVFHWIKLNGEKGASRQTPAAAPPPAAPAPRKPAPVAAAPRPAPVQAPVERTTPTPTESAAPVFAAAAAAQESQVQPESAPVMLASAAPTPAPDAPLALAARAVEPPPPPPQEEEAEVPLRLLSKVNPAIPAQMQRQSFREGYARVKFTVAPDGSVSKAETIKTSHNRLGTAAIDAVKQWRFAPIPTPREVAIEFAFNNLEE
jgi:TonB family protein